MFLWILYSYNCNVSHSVLTSFYSLSLSLCISLILASTNAYTCISLEMNWRRNLSKMLLYLFLFVYHMFFFSYVCLFIFLYMYTSTQFSEVDLESSSSIYVNLVHLLTVLALTSLCYWFSWNQKEWQKEKQFHGGGGIFFFFSIFFLSMTLLFNLGIYLFSHSEASPSAQNAGKYEYSPPSPTNSVV